MALQNLRSSTANKRPVATSLSDGQIALNINAASPGIFFKNSSNVLTKVGPIHIGTSAPNSSPAGSSGNAVGEQWMDTSGSAVVMKVWDGSAWQEQNKFGAVAGTAAAPSIYFAGDTDTGIYSPGANQLAISTNGTGRLFVNSSGRIGIGGATAAAPLQINSSSSNIYILLDDGTNGRLSIQADTNKTTLASFTTGAAAFEDIELRAAQHIFSRSGSIESARIDSSGRVGIGTTSPSVNLQIQDDSSFSLVRVVGSSSSVAGIDFGDAADTDTGGIRYDNVTDSMAFRVNASERARIDSSGRLLVGTSTALSAGSWAQYGKITTQGNTGNSAGTGIISIARGEGAATITSGEDLGAIAFTDNAGNEFGTITCAADANAGSGDYPGRLVFSTTADGASSPTERMRISSDGSISTAGILTAPSATVFGTVLGRTGAAGLFETSRNVGAAVTTATIRGNAGALNVHGDGDCENTNNSYGAISDIKLKENIVDAGSQWDDLKALQVRKYNFKAETGYNTHTQIGLVAQEAELVSPGLVGESIDEETGESTKSVNYSVLYMKAVKALQEAMERIEVLEAKVNALEGN